MENFPFLKRARPFPTPVTAKFLPSHASDKWGPRGLLKKNAITCVCALLPAAQASGGTGWESTKAACARCPEKRLGCAKGMWTHAMHHHAHEQLLPTGLSVHTSRSRQCTGALPCNGLPTAGSGVPVQGLRALTTRLFSESSFVYFRLKFFWGQAISLRVPEINSSEMAIKI